MISIQNSCRQLYKYLHLFLELLCVTPVSRFNYFSSFVILLIRFAKTGTLTVEEASSPQKPIRRSATSPGTATVLDVNPSTLMFIGGLGGQIKVKGLLYYNTIVQLADIEDDFLLIW